MAATGWATKAIIGAARNEAEQQGGVVGCLVSSSEFICEVTDECCDQQGLCPVKWADRDD